VSLGKFEAKVQQNEKIRPISGKDWMEFIKTERNSERILWKACREVRARGRW
jgi:hypothetical protein